MSFYQQNTRDCPLFGTRVSPIGFAVVMVDTVANFYSFLKVHALLVFGCDVMNYQSDKFCSRLLEKSFAKFTIEWKIMTWL